MLLTYDIEADGLLDKVTQVFCIVAQDVDTKKLYYFSDNDPTLPGIQEGIQLLLKADAIVGHNIISYDNSVIKKLYGVDLDHKPCIDTLIMSRVLNYMRFNGKHSLQLWGEYLGYSKIEFDDFTQYSKEMLEYCARDVELNTKVYEKLMQEYEVLLKREPKLKLGMKVEHTVQKINNQMRDEGWNFDLKKAKLTRLDMQDRMTAIERIMEPKLGTRTHYIDKEPKQPKYKKNGDYNSHTCNWLSDYFGHEVKPGDTHLMAPGTYFQRTKEVQIELGQVAHVKEWLYSIGWEPDDFTKVKTAYGWETKGPKLTDTSLEKLGEDGKLVSEYYTIRSRLGVLNTWISNCERSPDGRLHGDWSPIGTPSFRGRHSGIVNIPSVDAPWGREMRELFRADEGEVLVGADSSGNQNRGFCHYVGNAEYTDIVVNRDQHQYNAEVLGITRRVAKTFLYSYMFGAGDRKLGEVMVGKPDAKAGAKARAKFSEAVPGIEKLSDTLVNSWRARETTQGKGYFFGLDGRPVFAPADYQCLNYLLQACEGITCKAAMAWAYEKFKEEGLRAKFRIHYHDEMQITCHPDDVERVMEIAALSFREAPKQFGVNCMDGEASQGADYSETH